MILGIIIGYGLRRISFLRKVEVSISYTVFLLLFVLGVTIGSNRLIVDNLFFYGTHALPISICVPVIRSNSRLYLVIRFSSNTFSSIPTLSGL